MQRGVVKKAKARIKTVVEYVQRKQLLLIVEHGIGTMLDSVHARVARFDHRLAKYYLVSLVFAQVGRCLTYACGMRSALAVAGVLLTQCLLETHAARA